MVLRATGEIEGVNGGSYQRMYLPSDVSKDSQYPFLPGDKVRYQLVETTGNRMVLVVVPETLEVDADETELKLGRSSTEVQVELEEADA